MGWAGIDTDIADVLQTDVSDGVVTVTIGELSTEEGLGADLGLWGNGDGFVSVPNEPDGDGAAQVLWIQEGQTRRALAVRDRRYSAKGGALVAGDRAIVSSCEARLMLKKERNAITLYTTNDKDDGSAELVDLDGKNGLLTLLNGGAIIKLEKDKISFAVNGGGAIVLDKDGVQFIGQKCAINCTTVTIGLIPPGIPPSPGVNSALYGPAGQVGVASTSVTIAP